MTDEAQDPEDSEEGEDEEGGPKKGKRKLIIIAAAALVVVLGGGAAAYFLLFSGGGEEDTKEVIAAVQTYFYDLPEMTVNLADRAGGNEQFLKLSVSLELEDEAMVEAVAPRVTFVMDAFQVYLRELRRSDLAGSAGIYRLKDELQRRVNLAIYPARVESILFKEILVQ